MISLKWDPRSVGASHGGQGAGDALHFESQGRDLKKIPRAAHVVSPSHTHGCGHLCAHTHTHIHTNTYSHVERKNLAEV